MMRRTRHCPGWPSSFRPVQFGAHCSLRQVTRANAPSSS
jgi:hypothetical protein